MAQNFHRVKDTTLWVYNHKANSKLKYNEFSHAIDIKTVGAFMDKCSGSVTSGHCDLIEIFFWDNDTLEQSVWRTADRDDLIDLLTSAKQEGSTKFGMFTTMGPFDLTSMEFDEDVWSRRL